MVEVKGGGGGGVEGEGGGEGGARCHSTPSLVR